MLFALVSAASKENESTFHAAYSPIECNKLNVLAYAFIFICGLSIYLNSSIIWIFWRTKKIGVSINMFLFVLIVYNLIGTLLEFPLVIINHFNCKWVFHKAGCICSAFQMYFIACASIYLLVAISLERYYIFKHKINRPYLTVTKSILTIIVCSAFGLLWPVLPLFGWSHYSLETSQMTCSVEYQDRSFNVISYNIAMFAFVYFIPLMIIIGSNVKLAMLVKNVTNLIKKDEASQTQTIKNMLYRRKMRREKKITTVVIVIIVGYMFNWTPYAFVSLNTAFFNYFDIDPYTTLLLTLFAKSAFLWTPILYIVSDGEVRHNFKNLSMLQKKTSETETSFSIRPVKSLTMSGRNTQTLT